MIRLKHLFPSFLLFILCLFASTKAWSFPSVERTPGSGDAPLDLLNSQSSQLIVPQSGNLKDRYLIAVDGSSIKLIDTQTWKLAVTQPDSFDESIGGACLLANQTTLVVTLNDGNISKITLDDLESSNDLNDSATSSNSDDEDSDSEEETDSEEESSSSSNSDDGRLEEISDLTESGPLGAIVSDPESGSQIVYFLNTSDNLLIQYDFSDESLATVELDGTPADLVWADSDSGEKILISSGNGKVFVVDVGGSVASTIETPDDDEDLEADPTLTEMTVSPDGEHVFVVDTTNDVVWVIDVATESFVDQRSIADTNPIEFDNAENNLISHIAIGVVSDPDDTYLFISGEDGLSVADMSAPETAASGSKLVDLDDGTSDKDPISMSGVPGPVALSSVDDGYVYTSNGDATISVITDNPFVTIDETDSITINETDSTFSLTFQTDEVGTYTVVIGANTDGSGGTELISETTIDEGNEDTDITTDTIDMNSFDRDVFSEGDNRVFIFVTDADGNTGRDATDITVDRPPEAVTVTDLDFGDERVFVTIEPLSDTDIDSYVAVAARAQDQSSPSCPGSLNFDTDGESSKTLDASDCDGSTCEIIVKNLTNDVAYCVGVKAIDEGGQSGSYGVLTRSVSPENVVGPSGLLGESGCSLNPNRKFSLSSYILLALPLLVVIMRMRVRVLLMCVLLFFLSFSEGYAQSFIEETPPENDNVLAIHRDEGNPYSTQVIEEAPLLENDSSFSVNEHPTQGVPHVPERAFELSPLEKTNRVQEVPDEAFEIKSSRLSQQNNSHIEEEPLVAQVVNSDGSVSVYEEPLINQKKQEHYATNRPHVPTPGKPYKYSNPPSVQAPYKPTHPPQAGPPHSYRHPPSAKAPHTYRQPPEPGKPYEYRHPPHTAKPYDVSHPPEARSRHAARPSFIDGSEDGDPISEEEYEHPNTLVKRNPIEQKNFSFELKGAFWLPQNDVIEDFFGQCCNVGVEAEFGWLYKSQLNITMAVGYYLQSGTAIGETSGASSGESVKLHLYPIRNSILYRFDYYDEQIIVPYVGAGFDYVMFRESVGGDVTKGIKYGFHGQAGVAVLLDRIGDIGTSMHNMGVDDVYFVVEGRYAQVDSFSSSGLDLSGISIYFGFLMAF